MTIKKAKNNYWSPTPKHFRKLGDSLLASSTMLAGLSMYAGHEWIAIIVVVTGVLGKFITNFAKE